jgi:hypothetical protein
VAIWTEWDVERRARVEYERGDHAAAAEILFAATADRDDPDALYGVARRASSAGKRAVAMLYLRRAVELRLSFRERSANEADLDLIRDAITEL